MTSLDNLPAALQGWQNFYMLTGTAAATLTGLMFVAVTFGSSLVTKETAATARAFLDPTYMHFGQVLLTACLVMMPTLGPSFLGGLLIVIGAVRMLGLCWVFARYLEAQRTHGDVELSDWLVSIVLPLGCHLLVSTTGVGFILRNPASPTGLAIVSMSLLLIGIYGAWELLVWMALMVSERRREPPRSAPPSERPAAEGTE